MTAYTRGGPTAAFQHATTCELVRGGECRGGVLGGVGFVVDVVAGTYGDRRPAGWPVVRSSLVQSSPVSSLRFLCVIAVQIGTRTKTLLQRPIRTSASPAVALWTAKRAIWSLSRRPAVLAGVAAHQFHEVNAIDRALGFDVGKGERRLGDHERGGEAGRAEHVNGEADRKPPVLCSQPIS